MESLALQLPCEICNDLNERDHPSNYRDVSDARSFTAFVESSKNGCWGCKAMLAIFQAQGFDNEEQYSMSLYTEYLNSCITILVWENGLIPSGPDGSDNVRHKINVLSFPGSPCSWPKAVARPPISGDTGSDAAVACVRKWLDECLDQHRCFPARTSATELPTRILTIFGPQNVRLHISANDIAPYVCLSHCWGGKPPLRTTLSTLGQYQAGIIWEELPKTFREAIFFAYRLGFEYIWIDSLCIIQDSEEDWRQEASSMANIYENASLTLCATRSADSSEGCYATASSAYQFKKWSFVDSASNTVEVHTRSPLSHIAVTAGLPDIGNIFTAPLLFRGWTLQERLLSPRSVHFMETELVWDCSEGLTCECEEIQYNVLRGRKEDLQLNLWADHSMEDLHHQWQEIVLIYSDMSLTLSKDIFPALQGFAKKMPAKMGKYLAGLWQETLIPDLAWCASQSGTLSRPKEWRAPTWSWASTTASVWSPVTFTQLTKRTATSITVLEATTIPKGNDPTGELLAGELRIRGRGLKGNLIYLRSAATTEYYEDTDRYLDRPKFVIRFVDSQGLQHNDLSFDCNINWDYTIDSQGPDHIPDGSEVTLVRILGPSYPLFDEATIESNWLILINSNNSPGAFERVGSALLFRLFPRPHSVPELEKAYDASPEIEIRIV